MRLTSIPILWAEDLPAYTPWYSNVPEDFVLPREKIPRFGTFNFLLTKLVMELLYKRTMKLYQYREGLAKGIDIFHDSPI